MKKIIILTFVGMVLSSCHINRTKKWKRRQTIINNHLPYHITIEEIMEKRGFKY